jgi:hypothetical protein
MSILIISLPRTGSTSLLYKLAKENGLTPLFEPFDNSGRVQYNGEKNVIVKTIICHHPNNLELISNFDEIILLNRRNLKELIESHSYQTYFLKTGYNSNNPYVYKEPPQEIINLCTTDILNWNEEINYLSEITKIPITYYEDIFDSNSSDRLRLLPINKLI